LSQALALSIVALSRYEASFALMLDTVSL